MSRYIDADILKRMIEAKADTLIEGKQAFNCVAKWLDLLPSADVVEVVRCKDCKHRYVPYRCALWYGTAGDKDYFAERGEDFYCSYGERREE